MRTATNSVGVRRGRPWAFAANGGVWQYAVRLALLLLCVAAPASAQRGPRPAVVLHVVVSDTTTQPISAAEVLIMQGQRIVAAARTAAAGTARLMFVPDAVEYVVVARKLGFAQESLAVQLSPGDSVSFSITLGRSVQQLGTVRVAGRNLRRESYFLDAETIATSPRLVRSAMDAVLGLRPDMLIGRSGWRICMATLQEVWINGQRMSKNLEPDPAWVGRQLPGVPPDAPPVPPEVLTLLSRVRAEHIAEMTYVDCFGSPVQRAGSDNAVFIVLKPGVEFRWPYGTFAVDDDSTGAATQ